MWLCAVEGGYVAMSSSAARKARIGEVPQAEGFGKNRRCRFDKLAEKPLCGCGGNPFGSDEPLPLPRRCAATQGKTLPVAAMV